MPAVPERIALAETLGQAAATGFAHPLRSALGALAIAVAVATLAVVDAALAGLTLFAQRSAARAFGSETFVIAQVASPGQVSRRELERMLERNPAIRRADLRFLESVAGGRVVYAATVQQAADVTAGGRKFENATVTGTGAALAEIRDLGLSSGRFFTADEERRAALVAVIGRDVADRLFPGLDPLGRTVRVGGRGFAVVGAQARLGTLSGQSLDRSVFVPLAAHERLFGAPRTLLLSARAPASGELALAEDRARASLRARHSLWPGDEDDFGILEPAAARSFVLSLAGRVGAAAPPISAMALLAAVVVVANTTLVSVTQRTREIGVRRALGASRAQVVREVLAEACLVALVGGIAGLLVAAVLVKAAAGAAGLALALRPVAVLWALTASAVSGLLAGWYPARKAARIDVAAALRSE
jgi:putative ABC transport system permease protein